MHVFESFFERREIALGNSSRRRAHSTCAALESRRPGGGSEKNLKKVCTPGRTTIQSKSWWGWCLTQNARKKGENCMIYSKSSNTKRFQFGVSQNNTAKKAGSNVLTISTRAYDNDFYSTPTTQLSMTIKEARSLQSFLNSALPIDNVE